MRFRPTYGWGFIRYDTYMNGSLQDQRWFGHYENGCCFMAMLGMELAARGQAGDPDGALALAKQAMVQFNTSRFWGQHYDWCAGDHCEKDAPGFNGADVLSNTGMVLYGAVHSMFGFRTDLNGVHIFGSPAKALKEGATHTFIHLGKRVTLLVKDGVTVISPSPSPTQHVPTVDATPTTPAPSSPQSPSAASPLALPPSAAGYLGGVSQNGDRITPPPPASKFGIGVYTDTVGSPAAEVQLDAAQGLVGRGGWVTLLLCSWREGATRSCMNASTTHDDASNKALLAAYSRGLNVVARIGNPYYVRDHADDADQGTHTNYTSLAAAYARLVASLPPPPGTKPLYVTVGNEFNACNEWRCSSSANVTMGTQTMELEVASFARHVAAALAPLRTHGSGQQGLRQSWRPGQLKLGHLPVSDWDTSPCQCSTGSALGQGRPGLKFLEGMLLADAGENAVGGGGGGGAYSTGLYSPDSVDFLVSHSYPYSGAPWGDPKAYRGLTYYRNESITVGWPGMPTMITETGWRRDQSRHITDHDRANWTVLSYERYWLDDPQVVGVHPFLLAGTFWDALGWPWMNVTSSNGGGSGGGGGGGVAPGVPTLVPSEVYTAVKELRCTVMGVGGGGCN